MMSLLKLTRDSGTNRGSCSLMAPRCIKYVVICCHCKLLYNCCAVILTNSNNFPNVSETNFTRLTNPLFLYTALQHRDIEAPHIYHGTWGDVNCVTYFRNRFRTWWSHTYVQRNTRIRRKWTTVNTHKQSGAANYTPDLEWKSLPQTISACKMWDSHAWWSGLQHSIKAALWDYEKWLWICSEHPLCGKSRSDAFAIDDAGFLHSRWITVPPTI